MCDEGEKASGARDWIVTMEEERRVRKEKQKRKDEDKGNGGQNIPPTPLVTWVAESTLPKKKNFEIIFILIFFFKERR